MSQAAHSILDTALNETLHAVRPVPVLPLLLSLGVDQRISVSNSLVTLSEASIILLTFFNSPSYSVVEVVTCAPIYCCCSTSVLAHSVCAFRSCAD